MPRSIDDSEDVAAPSNLDVPIDWTQFFSVAALKKIEHQESLRQIAERILHHTRPEKIKLHWIKFAVFGEERSPKGSYRTNANILEVTGCEADYDAGEMTPEEARELLASAGICALVYTTPSHTIEKPRWRVLAPFSRHYERSYRAKFLARLNGVLGGVLAPESFTDSLSYFYGRPADKPPIYTFPVEGDFIDTRDDLDEGAIGKHDNDDTIPPPASDRLDMSDEEFAQVVRMLDNTGDRFETRAAWIEVVAAIHHQFQGNEEGRELAHEWSGQWGGYDPDYTDATWDSLGKTHGRTKTGAFILMLAKEWGWTGKPGDVEPTEVFETIEPDEDEIAQPEGDPDEDDDILGPPPTRVLPPDDFDPILALNDRHAIVSLGNKVRVMQEQPNGTIKFYETGGFHTLFANNRVPNGPRSTIPISEAWMVDPRRRTYMGGVVFKPNGRTPKHIYNLFKGFTAQPNPEGSCKLFLDHLYENVCAYNEVSYRYTIGWMAHLVQHPEIKPGVAVVLKGKKGVGKDVVAFHLSRLFRHNYVKISDMDQLTGKFNAHFERALLIHCEEAIWAGDKRAEGPLKSLITSPHMALEKKGVDVDMVDNFSRVLISSNENWVVPVTKDERRFFVLLVADTHRRDRPYFRDMEDQMNAGGYGALMHFLSTYDLSGFDVGDVPDTEGLTEQKVIGLKGADAFWRECLETVEIPIEVEHFNKRQVDWRTDWVRSEVDGFHDVYEVWWQKHQRYGHGPLLSKEDLGRELTKMCPSRWRSQRRENGGKITVHRFPPLAQCRAEFETYLGSKVEWPEGIVDEGDDEDLIG